MTAHRCLVAWVAIVVSTLVLCDGVQAQEWLFSADGKTTWSWGRYWQLGKHGFFGLYDVDSSATGDYASLNGWIPVRSADDPRRDLVSGTDGSSSTLGLDFAPRVDHYYATVTGRYKINAYETNSAEGVKPRSRLDNGPTGTSE